MDKTTKLIYRLNNAYSVIENAQLDKDTLRTIQDTIDALCEITEAKKDSIPKQVFVITGVQEEEYEVPKETRPYVFSTMEKAKAKLKELASQIEEEDCPVDMETDNTAFYTFDTDKKIHMYITPKIIDSGE